MLAQISKWGNSSGIRMPKAILDQAKFGESEKVEIIVNKGTVEIRKAASKLTLKSIFQGYEGEKEQEYDFGAPKGREVW